MIARLPHAVSLSLTVLLATASGACGASRPAAGAPTPAPVLEPVAGPVAEPAPKRAEPAAPAAPEKPEKPEEAGKPSLPAGAPFYGAYELQRIAMKDGRVEVAGLAGCRDISDCVLRRRTYVFEGKALRLRYVLVSITDKKGDESLTSVCDAQAQVDVQWEGDTMFLPTTLVARSNSDLYRRKQKKTGPHTFDIDWHKDHLGCSATMFGARYRVKEVSREMRGNRPARIVLESPDETHELEAADEEPDVKRAINAFFGQT